MEKQSIFAILSFVFCAAAYGPYVQAVLKARARPTVSAWISWGIMDGAIFAGMIAQHDIAYQMVAYLVGVGAVIGSCIYMKAMLGWKPLDSFCMTLVLIAVVIWIITSDADLDILLSLAAIVIACVPMVINTWGEPEREPALPWLLNLTGGLFGILAIQNWTIAGSLTQITFFVVSVIFNLLILRKFLPSRNKVVHQILMRD